MSAAPPMLESLRIRGFRSLEDVELSGLPAATVLIGPNGAGKSNILRFLDLLRHMLRHRQLMSFLSWHGGAGNQLFSGAANADQIEAEITLKKQRRAVRLSLCPGIRPSGPLFIPQRGVPPPEQRASRWQRMAGPGQRPPRG